MDVITYVTVTIFMSTPSHVLTTLQCAAEGSDHIQQWRGASVTGGLRYRSFKAPSSVPTQLLDLMKKTLIMGISKGAVDY